MKIDESKITDCIYRAVDEINNPLPDEDKVKKAQKQFCSVKIQL